MFKKIVFAFIIITLPRLAAAQKTDSTKLPKIQVLARVTSQNVILRWAPDNANAWLLGNKFGYIIERYTFLRNKKTTDTQTKTILTVTPIKPWPLEQWKAMVDTSDYAAVAAQAIHGADFEVNINKKGDIAAVFSKVKETESRFTFALHSANQSLLIAEASGLLFQDNTSNKNEAYLYRIYPAIPKNLMRIDTAILFVDASKPDKLPKLREVTATTSGKAVMIYWSTLQYDRDYVSYKIERSDDGGHNFHALSNRPYVSMGNEGSPIPGRAVYVDSLPQFNIPYFYRVRGFTSFAETGPPSDSIIITAQKELYNSPSVKSADIINGKVCLRWELPGKTTDAVKGFQIERALSFEGKYSQINKRSIPSDVKIFIDSIPSASNYYRILAIDKKGNSHPSMPYFVQLEDSIPPTPPVEFSGTIDSSGTVNLIWKSNTEPDILGYRVYRSYFTSAEFVQVTTDPIKQNHFREKIKLKNLNKYLYYKITASDAHHNQSGFSTMIKIIQPDIMPPSSPAIKTIKASAEGIKIIILPSSSDDVEKYLIYRRKNLDSLWTLEKVITSISDPLYFTDSTALFGNIYVYNILAIDSSGNESIPTPTVKYKALNGNDKSLINIHTSKDLEKKVIEIKWSGGRSDIVSLILYKATGEEPMAQYATCKANQGLFSDQNVKLNNKYRYMVKAIYSDGTESRFSAIEIVNY